ncbi:MAG: class IIb bacteriocin, lactobin A/cerein 7B family [Tenuifilaceae bacterium]|nr:class IIb bacteriocin, lactobin A/cerein 7B family [Tenuifilaceae bacterium]
MNNLGVQELDAREMVEVDGGLIITVLALAKAISVVSGMVASHIAWEATTNPDAHSAAWNRGKERALAEY